MLVVFCAAFLLPATALVHAQGLVILHTNDTHSHIDPVKAGPEAGLGGVIERAAYIDSVRAAVGERNLLLVDAGDFSQGSSYFTILKGDLEVEVMNAMGYDVSALGNHEFDNGSEDLARRLSKAKFDVVCANYDFSGSRLGKLVKPYTVVRKAGRKIGIIGLLVDFTDIRLAEASHNGDMIIGGHSHTFLEEPVYVKDADGDDVMIVTDGCWGLYVGKLEVE